MEKEKAVAIDTLGMNTVPKIDTATAQPADHRPNNGIDPAEWQTRVDLAACYRLVDLYGMTDLHLNHISARVPGNAAYIATAINSATSPAAIARSTAR